LLRDAPKLLLEFLVLALLGESLGPVQRKVEVSSALSSSPTLREGDLLPSRSMPFARSSAFARTMPRALPVRLASSSIDNGSAINSPRNPHRRWPSSRRLLGRASARPAGAGLVEPATASRRER
jgi:hypothetical protein